MRKVTAILKMLDLHGHAASKPLLRSQAAHWPSLWVNPRYHDCNEKCTNLKGQTHNASAAKQLQLGKRLIVEDVIAVWTVLRWYLSIYHILKGIWSPVSLNLVWLKTTYASLPKKLGFVVGHLTPSFCPLNALSTTTSSMCPHCNVTCRTGEQRCVVCHNCAVMSFTSWVPLWACLSIFGCTCVNRAETYHARESWKEQKGMQSLLDDRFYDHEYLVLVWRVAYNMWFMTEPQYLLWCCSSLCKSKHV